jgi:hypothetical protein
MFTADPLPTLLAGLAVGVVFGFLLQKGQVTRYATIVGQFLLVDHTVLRIMLTAIVVGAVGVWGMLALGWIEHLHVKPALLAANATGGLIFGVGMASLGYCPGTGVGAAAEGSRHAWFGVTGMVFGALAYAFAYPALERGFLHVGDLGKVTFADLTGASPWWFIGGLAVIALSVFAGLAKMERTAAL